MSPLLLPEIYFINTSKYILSREQLIFSKYDSGLLRTSFTCDEFNNASSQLTMELAYNNLTTLEAKCFYNKPTDCEMDDLMGLKGKKKIEQCFESTTREKCTSWDYNDSVFNDTIVKDPIL